MALTYAYLTANELQKAEMVFNRSLRLDLSQVKALLHPKVLNAFIEAHLSVTNDSGPGYIHAKEWFSRFNLLDLSPTAVTFALFLDYSLKTGRLDLVREWLDILEASPVSIASVLSCSKFPDKESRAPLEAYLRSIGKSTTPVLELDDLLLSAMEDIQDPVAKSPKPSDSELISVEASG